MRRDEGNIRERSKGRWEIRVELGRGPDGMVLEELQEDVEYEGSDHDQMLFLTGPAAG